MADESPSAAPASSPSAASTGAAAASSSGSDAAYAQQFPGLPPPSQQHALQAPFSFWYLNKKKAPVAGDAYEENIKKMATFSTVEEFWSIYSHLARPNDLPSSLNFHLFRAGIAPMWEDPANAQGGKWMLRLKKGMASRVWEDVLLAVIGDAFHLGDEVCGAVLVTKNGEDVLSLWNRSAGNKEATARIRETLRRVLDLPANAPLEYRPHEGALKNVQVTR